MLAQDKHKSGNKKFKKVQHSWSVTYKIQWFLAPTVKERLTSLSQGVTAGLEAKAIL